MNPEIKRGLTEARQHFEALRARWPQAFPAKGHEVRPLALGATSIVAAEMGWPNAYARGVLMSWKMREAYCRAILDCPERITLDGAPSGETVDDEARVMAHEQIIRIKARRARQEAERKARPAAAAPEQLPASPAAAVPTPEPEPPSAAPLPRPAEEPRKHDSFAALRQAFRSRAAAA